MGGAASATILASTPGGAPVGQRPPATLRRLNTRASMPSMLTALPACSLQKPPLCVHLHAAEIYEEDAPPGAPALYHNVLRLDVPVCASVKRAAVGRKQAGQGWVREGWFGSGSGGRATTRRPSSRLQPAPCALQALFPHTAGTPQQPHLWMTGGRRLPRYSSTAASSHAMRLTSASSARQPPATMSARLRPWASSCSRCGVWGGKGEEG